MEEERIKKHIEFCMRNTIYGILTDESIKKQEEAIKKYYKENKRVKQMMKENRRVCNVKTIISATKLYLIIGIISVSIAITLLIAIATYLFSNRNYYAFILSIPIIIAFIFGIDMISIYAKRQEIHLYLYKLDDNVSVKYIRENYTIVDINEQYILFVDKGNRKYFNEWKLFNGYSNLNSFALKFKDFSVY